MSRDGSGTYTLPTNSFTVPVAGTTISPTDASTFWADLQTELTDSLSRTGKGGMSAALAVASNSASSLAIGRLGATTPAFQVDSSTASQVAGIKVTGAATGGTVALGVIDSGSNANLSIDAKGSGTITINGTGTGGVTIGRALTYGGVALSNAVTGTGNMVLSTSPVLTTPNLGTPSAAVLTNATGLPVGGLAAQAAYTFVGNNTGSSASPTAVDIALLTSKVSPAAGDYIILSDQAASGAWKKATVSSVASAGSVSSIATNTGAFTLSHGLTNSTNDLQIDIATQRGYLTGLTLSTAGSSTTFGISVGVAVDSTAADFMKLTSAYTKTTASWAVGSGNGGLDTGTTLGAANTWYHVHLIKRVDTGVVDVLFSLSATAPTMPTNYTLFRRIGSMKTDGSKNWILFSQLGDEFLWDVPVVDIAAGTASSTTGVGVTLTVPTGVQVIAALTLRADFVTSGNALIISSPDVANTAASATNNNLYVTAGNTPTFNAVEVRSNTSAVVRQRSDNTNLQYGIVTKGWRDYRGKNS